MKIYLDRVMRDGVKRWENEQLREEIRLLKFLLQDETQKASIRMARHRRNKAQQAVTVAETLHIAEAEAEAEAKAHIVTPASRQNKNPEISGHNVSNYVID